MSCALSTRVWLSRAVIAICTVGVCMIVLEAGLRLIGRSPTNMTDGIFVQHDNSYRLMKNTRKVTRWPSFSYTTYTNKYGFRDKSAEGHDIEGKRYVLFLGASQTFGNGVDFEDSFVGIIAERLLRDNVHSLNLAIGGHHLVEQFALMRDFLEGVSTNPEAVFIGLDPLTISKFDMEHEEIFVKGGYTFHRDNWIVPYIKTILSNRSAAYCYFRDSIRRLQVKISPPDMNDGAFYFQLYSIRNPIRSESRQIEFRRELDSLVDYVCSVGAEPIIIHVPAVAGFSIKEMALRADLDPAEYNSSFYGELVTSYCVDRDIKIVDPEELLLGLHSEGRQLSFALDAHYNTFTNRKMGDYIIEKLMAE